MMTELEKYLSAKRAVDCLANGLNPFDGEPLPDDTILNNVYVARALFVASDALKVAIAAERKGKKKDEFNISENELKNFEFSEDPISASEITRRINYLIKDSYMKKFSYNQLVMWVESKGLITTIIHNDKAYREATDTGNKIGITSGWRKTIKGIPFMSTLYNLEAQHFIIDNLPCIISENLEITTEG